MDAESNTSATRDTEQPDAWVLAIDFGTSFSSAALAAHGTVDLIDLHGDRRVPSMVLLDEDGTLLVGLLAANQAAGSPERLERTPKAQVGRSPGLLLGGQLVPVVDAVAAIVTAFLEEARRRRGGSQPAAVTLTHPVRWGADRRQVLMDAAIAAGLDSQRAQLIEEPVAAAAAFGSERMRPGSLVAVYDLGGGTFDAAVLQATQTGFVVAGPPGGHDTIGGEAFDERLLTHIGQQAMTVDPDGWQALLTSDERRWRRAHAQLHDQIRLAKETLSVAGQATVFVPGIDRDILVTRTEFEHLIADDVNLTLGILDDVIHAADTTPQQLAAIYPVGGSSRIPLVANQLLARYGNRVITWDDPQAAVALGAARIARHTMKLLDHDQRTQPHATPQPTQTPTTPTEPVTHPAATDPAPVTRASDEPVTPVAAQPVKPPSPAPRPEQSRQPDPPAPAPADPPTARMPTTPTPPAPPPRPPADPQPQPPRRRRTRIWLIAAATTLTIAGGATLLLTAGRSDGTSSEVGPPPPPPPAGFPPDGATTCSEDPTVATDSSTTTCPFALNVKDGWYKSSSNTVEAFSPELDRTITMECDELPDEVVECTGGVDAVVYVNTANEPRTTKEPGTTEQPGTRGAPGPGGTTEQPGTRGATGPGGLADRLRSYIPSQISDCTTIDLSEGFASAGTAGLECAGNEDDVDDISYVYYDNPADLLAEFRKVGDDLPRGDCAVAGWEAEDTLRHDGAVAGRLKCYDTKDGTAVLEWINENLKVYVYARSKSGDRDALRREFVDAGPDEP